MKKLLSIMFMLLPCLHSVSVRQLRLLLRSSAFLASSWRKNRHSTLPTTWLSMRRQKVSLLTLTPVPERDMALGPRPRRNRGGSEAQTEQQIKQRFEMSEKILNIRQKYYKKYSQFLTQNQIQRVYEIERQMMKRFAQKGKQNGGKPGARRAPRGGNM